MRAGWFIAALLKRKSQWLFMSHGTTVRRVKPRLAADPLHQDANLIGADFQSYEPRSNS
jgi:hypothetical protein